MTTPLYPSDRTALLLVDPYNELNGPTYAHAILTTSEMLAALPVHSAEQAAPAAATPAR